MSPERSIHTGWHDIDDVPVPVRVGTAAAGPAAAQVGAPPAHGVPSTAGVSPRAMQAAAVLGISIVLIATAFYFGIDSLRGGLTNTVANVTTVTITEDGHFSPSNIAIAAGSMLTVENKNRDPQVLKAKSRKQLFPVQVLFETPYSFTVPIDAVGTYLYVSETLRESETLTITVFASIEGTAASAGSRPVSDALLPAPSTEPPAVVTAVAEPQAVMTAVAGPSVASVGPSASQRAALTPPRAQGVAPTEHGSDVAIISLGTDQTQDESLQGNQLPINPYTVTGGHDRRDIVTRANNARDRSAQIASSAKARLHSGAPLRPIRPNTVTQTGSELWLLILPAVAMMLLVYRRMDQRLISVP